MGEERAGKHRPQEGRWTPAKRPESGFTVWGKATLRLLGKLSGWNNVDRDRD